MYCAATAVVAAVQVIVASGRRVEVTFCDQCGVFRPPRAEHCAECNVCVLQYVLVCLHALIVLTLMLCVCVPCVVQV